MPKQRQKSLETAIGKTPPCWVLDAGEFIVQIRGDNGVFIVTQEILKEVKTYEGNRWEEHINKYQLGDEAIAQLIRHIGTDKSKDPEGSRYQEVPEKNITEAKGKGRDALIELFKNTMTGVGWAVNLIVGKVHNTLGAASKYSYSVTPPQEV